MLWPPELPQSAGPRHFVCLTKCQLCLIEVMTDVKCIFSTLYHASLFIIIAFSKFATAEYLVAVMNMAFYWTIVKDLPSEEIVVLHPSCCGLQDPQAPCPLPAVNNNDTPSSPINHQFQSDQTTQKEHLE